MDNLKNECLVGILTYNNGLDIKTTIEKIPRDYKYNVLIHVDGSTDGSDKILDNYEFSVIRQEKNSGIGSSIRNVIFYAIKNDYKYCILLPGNNKNDPNEAERILKPIVDNKADFVQGSRYLEGSRRDYTPVFRLVMVKFYSLFFSIIAKRKITDALEGFRAIRLSIFDDTSINLNQEWLNTYGLETYLFFKVVKSKIIRYCEVGVSKVYPKDKKHLFNQEGKKYSHIRPFVDWWHIIKPIFFLTFGIKK